MPAPIRVTGPLLEILDVLLLALSEDTELHGWAIAKAVKRSGPTVYGVIDRLQDAGWVAGCWEDENPQPGKPRRRLYRLTPTGAAQAADLIAARRPRSSAARPVPGLAFTGRFRSALFGSPS
jgi:DNA-binding PadR family transcriptional regulator